MWNYSFVIPLLALMISFLASDVFGINCLQCSTITDRSGKCISGEFQSKPCVEENKKKYCMRYVSFLKNGVPVVYRKCTGKNVNPEKKCEEKVINNKPVWACLTTCDTDGCNGEPVPLPYNTTPIQTTYSMFTILTAMSIYLMVSSSYENLSN
ncbi:uncharacterized protein LOC141904237 [Tubulanus polymorphus]|uniref:uncharacterized protein LOC141904237 n=1 Tax=Tubulanus polymorphus TaxID=672921 RepID=UPI003DA596BF